MDYAKELASFKRRNKEARLKKAQKEGYATSEAYIAFLEGKISGVSKKPTKAKVVSNKATIVPTIHVVDIIDCSGSMAGGKLTNAIEGINLGIKSLQKDKTASYYYTLCNFSSANDINFKFISTSISKVEPVIFHARGLTALYDAIGDSINKLLSIKGKKDKVLVNIYTDGEENGSNRYHAQSISTLIDSVKELGFTVTFVGTERDTIDIINTLGIDSTNTLAYDGTASGLKKTMDKTLVARQSYATAVADGQDVSKGFYKNINV